MELKTLKELANDDLDSTNDNADLWDFIENVQKESTKWIKDISENNLFNIKEKEVMVKFIEHFFNLTDGEANETN